VPDAMSILYYFVYNIVGIIYMTDAIKTVNILWQCNGTQLLWYSVTLAALNYLVLYVWENTGFNSTSRH